jgi:hypothetical protein
MLERENFMNDTLPILHPEEHAAVEQIAGRKLSNDEAQILLREATIAGAFERWIEERQ